MPNYSTTNTFVAGTTGALAFAAATSQALKTEDSKNFSSTAIIAAATIGFAFGVINNRLTYKKGINEGIETGTKAGMEIGQQKALQNGVKIGRFAGQIEGFTQGRKIGQYEGGIIGGLIGAVVGDGIGRRAGYQQGVKEGIQSSIDEIDATIESIRRQSLGDRTENKSATSLSQSKNSSLGFSQIVKLESSNSLRSQQTR